jgi:hypothetical protein
MPTAMALAEPMKRKRDSIDVMKCPFLCTGCARGRGTVSPQGAVSRAATEA